MNSLKSTILFLITLVTLFILVTLLGCANAKTFLGLNSSEAHKPISNPFGSLETGSKSDSSQNMILRTRKGDRSVELEIPGDSEHLSDFVLPISPAFKDHRRSPASVSSFGDEDIVNSEYKEHPPTFSDREIAQSLARGSEEDEKEKQTIEQGLYLKASGELPGSNDSVSYLARIDHIKQLFRASRFEAALLETDELVRAYSLDPKLYEMRGTLLDRMGRKELALKSWNQALRLDPKNDGLRKYLSRKLQTPLTVDSP